MIKNKIVPFIPKSLEYPNYSDKNYWRLVYEKSIGTYEWYEDYETISPIIKQLKLPKRSNILHIGIGNSEFSEKMYDEGYKKSYNIDFSRNVIHYMKQRNKKLRGSMIFETMNALNLDYEDNQFDIVFDKATFDCILCGIDADTKSKIFMNEVFRVIKPKGFYFLISNSGPESRLKYLQSNNIRYDIFVHKIINDQEQTKIYEDNSKKVNFMKDIHYIYICKKLGEIKNNEKEKSNKDKVKKDELNSGENMKKNKKSINLNNEEGKNINGDENINNNNEEK